MSKRETFYADLKFLVSQPQWNSYEKWLNEKQESVVEEFLHGPGADLDELRIRAKTIGEIKQSVYQLIKEVELAAKEKNK